MRRLIAPILLALVLSGCSSLRESAHGATALDAASTIVGVGSGAAVEANPLIGTPAVFAGLMLARVIGVEMADQMPEPQRTRLLTGWSSIWWGAGVSNLLILVAAANPVGLAAGAMVGLGLWKSTEHQREFATLCATLRAEVPELKCTYTTPG